jgi:putative protease
MGPGEAGRDPVEDQGPGARGKRLHDSWDREKANYRRPLHAKVIGRLGQPLRVEFNDGEGHVVAGESAMPCAAAEKRPMDVTTLRDQLGRLGDTGFELGGLQADLEGALIVPVSELNRLRRDLAEQITKLRRQPLRWTLLPYAEASTKVAPFEPKRPGEAEIVVVIREPEQLEPALRERRPRHLRRVQRPKKFRAAVARVRAYEQEAGRKVEFWAMGPRIHKQGEERVSEIVLSCEADGYLVRNHENLRAFKGKRLRRDFSLNVANGLTRRMAHGRARARRPDSLYDLDSEQVAALLRSAPPEWFEVTIHQHMPMFHMEHCVFCTFLSKGKDYRDCGRPCEKHRVRAARPRRRRAHPQGRRRLPEHALQLARPDGGRMRHPAPLPRRPPLPRGVRRRGRLDRDAHAREISGPAQGRPRRHRALERPQGPQSARRHARHDEG